MVKMVFCDLSHTFHKQVTNVSQHVFVIVLRGILMSPLGRWTTFAVLLHPQVDNAGTTRALYCIESTGEGLSSAHGVGAWISNCILQRNHKVSEQGTKPIEETILDARKVQNNVHTNYFHMCM